MYKKRVRLVRTRIPMKALAETISRCLKDDRRAQEALYRGHFNFMMSIYYRYENNEQDALALVNKVFLKVLNKLEVYDPKQPFLPWLKRLALNTAIDEIRLKKRINGQLVLMDDDEWNVADNHFEELDVEAADATYEELIAMLNSLPEPERTVFNLFAIDNQGHKDIAALLGISERSSKRHLRSAREQLQRKLHERDLKMKGVS